MSKRKPKTQAVTPEVKAAAARANDIAWKAASAAFESVYRETLRAALAEFLRGQKS